MSAVFAAFLFVLGVAGATVGVRDLHRFPADSDAAAGIAALLTLSLLAIAGALVIFFGGAS